MRITHFFQQSNRKFATSIDKVFTFSQNTILFTSENTTWLHEHLNSASLLIFHGLETVQSVPRNVRLQYKTYLHLLGAEYEPLSRHLAKYYLPLTLKYFHQQHKYNRIPLPLFAHVWEIRRRLLEKRFIRSLHDLQIDYISAGNGNTKLHSYLNSNQNIDPVEFYYQPLAVRKPPENFPNTAIIGNSASLSNNHRDLLNLKSIQNLMPESSLTVPLGYGDESNAIAVRSMPTYKKAKCLPQDLFLDYDEYVTMLRKHQFYISGHMRQEGRGTLNLAIQNGLTAVVVKDSANQQYLERIGVSFLTNDQRLLKLPISTLEKNQAQLVNHYSKAHANLKNAMIQLTEG